MGLSEVEKQIGRQFRREQAHRLDSLNEADPATYEVPHFLGLYRHLCAARDNRSTAMELKEQYVASPIYSHEGVPAGRFGFIFREGQCRACGQTARSETGRLVDGWQRPPLTGRVARS